MLNDVIFYAHWQIVKLTKQHANGKLVEINYGSSLVLFVSDAACIDRSKSVTNDVLFQRGCCFEPMQEVGSIGSSLGFATEILASAYCPTII